MQEQLESQLLLQIKHIVLKKIQLEIFLYDIFENIKFAKNICMTHFFGKVLREDYTIMHKCG